MPASSFEDANAVHRAMRMMAATKVGRVFFRPTAHRFDQLLSRLTRGKHSFAGIAAGLPSVMLTTTGAKTGLARTVALLGIPHPEGVAVVAANYGGAKHPAWYHNLTANPAASVLIEGAAWDATARLANAAERGDIWTRGVAIFPGLAKEQEWAGDRRIAVFILHRDQPGD